MWKKWDFEIKTIHSCLYINDFNIKWVPLYMYKHIGLLFIYIYSENRKMYYVIIFMNVLKSNGTEAALSNHHTLNKGLKSILTQPLIEANATSTLIYT